MKLGWSYIKLFRVKLHKINFLGQICTNWCHLRNVMTNLLGVVTSLFAKCVVRPHDLYGLWSHQCSWTDLGIVPCIFGNEHLKNWRQTWVIASRGRQALIWLSWFAFLWISCPQKTPEIDTKINVLGWVDTVRDRFYIRQAWRHDVAYDVMHWFDIFYLHFFWLRRHKNHEIHTKSCGSTYLKCIALNSLASKPLKLTPNHAF